MALCQPFSQHLVLGIEGAGSGNVVLDARKGVLGARYKQAVRNHPRLRCFCHPLGDKVGLLW